MKPKFAAPPLLGKTANSNFLMKEFYLHKNPPKYIRKLNEFKNNISSDETDTCKINIQYRAKVVFTLATDNMPVTVMKRRLSFFDKMSAFGKHKHKNDNIRRRKNIF